MLPKHLVFPVFPTKGTQSLLLKHHRARAHTSGRLQGTEQVRSTINAVVRKAPSSLVSQPSVKMLMKAAETIYGKLTIRISFTSHSPAHTQPPVHQPFHPITAITAALCPATLIRWP